MRSEESAVLVCKALEGCRLTMFDDSLIEVRQDDGTWYIQAIEDEVLNIKSVALQRDVSAQLAGVK